MDLNSSSRSSSTDFLALRSELTESNMTRTIP